MIATMTDCTICFPEAYDARGEWEVEAKGWLQGAVAELPDGRRFPLYFYDPVRLAEELGSRGMIAEPGLIVLPELTRQAMEAAIRRLSQTDFFESLQPLE